VKKPRGTVSLRLMAIPGGVWIVVGVPTDEPADDLD